MISPVSISSVVLVQIFILAIMFLGSLFLWAGLQEVGSFGRVPPEPSVYLWLIGGVGIMTVGALALSGQPLVVSRPEFGITSIPQVELSWAHLVLFFLDFVCVVVLVFGTGGSRVSPFTPIYFILPPLAIFLGETPRLIIGCFICSAIAFTMTLPDATEPVQRTVGARRAMFTYWFVSISSLVTTFVAFVTRPQ
jgi:hypothetical protein